MNADDLCYEVWAHENYNSETHGAFSDVTQAWALADALTLQRPNAEIVVIVASAYYTCVATGAIVRRPEIK